MCILCHCGDKGDTFLGAFQESRSAMQRAAAAMRICATTALHPTTQAPDPEVRRQYARVHKQMVRLLRAWNKIEQEREQIHREGAPHV